MRRFVVERQIPRRAPVEDQAAEILRNQDKRVSRHRATAGPGLRKACGSRSVRPGAEGASEAARGTQRLVRHSADIDTLRVVPTQVLGSQRALEVPSADRHNPVRPNEFQERSEYTSM